MQKAEYRFLFRRLGLSVAFLCSSLSGTALASGLFDWNAPETVKQLPPPSPVTMQSFRAAAKMPADYLGSAKGVDYSLKLAYYSHYAATYPHKNTAVLAKTNTKPAPAQPQQPQKLVGYLDDEGTSSLPSQHHSAPAKLAAAPVPIAPAAPEVHSQTVATAAAPEKPLVTLPWLAEKAPHEEPASQMAANVPQPVDRKTAKVVLVKNESIQQMLAENESLAVPQLHMPASAKIPLPSFSPDTKTGALSDEDKQIISTLPHEKGKHKAVKSPPVHIKHMQKNPLDTDAEVEKRSGVGIQISVRRPKANIEMMLEEAYQNLMDGNQESAIELYKNVLEMQPTNKLALFGLATTYHRAGQAQLARPLYGKLLAIDPDNVEGLNNYLVLLADQAPEESLVELGRLERSHPTFSPIPAQMAIIYEKQGNYAFAAKKMAAAIDLSPENLKYRYNMAIILDQKGDWDDAAVLYKELLVASERGEKIAVDPDEIQQRLTFILSNRPKG